ncbi:MAG: hypothetical protein ACKOPQ_14580 [Novosphingobium sp.]
MRIEITRGQSDDAITMTRRDGSTAATRFPKKGPVPHDAVHYFVERGLNLRQGFWGMVAAGHHPEDIAELAKAAGHASAKRFGVPDAAIVELLQAERLVECFEADLWSPGGAGDAQAFCDFAAVACQSSLVPLPSQFAAHAEGIRNAIASFALEWMDLPQGGSMQFDLDEGD